MKLEQVLQIPGKAISPHTPLWRYMSTGAFMVLLQGKTFVPSLEELRKADPKESLIPLHSEDDLPEHLFDGNGGGELRDWLDEKLTAKGRQPSVSENTLVYGLFKNRLLMSEWLIQLAMRRAVWCWFRSDDESMAMWNLYAKNGIAIKSTFKQVVEALNLPDDAATLAVGIEYHRQGDWNEKLLDKEYIDRPFIFKHSSYIHESEVRVVIRIKPAEGAGVEIDIDAATLLSAGEAVISPYVRKKEAGAFIKTIQNSHPGLKIRHSTQQQESPFPTKFQDAMIEDLAALSQPFQAENGLPARLRTL